MSKITLSFLHRNYLVISLLFVLTVLSRPSIAQGQSAGTSPAQPDSLYEIYEHPEKSLEARCGRAKAFLEKFPNVDDYWKKGPRATLKRCELIQTYTQCQNADKSYFASPNTDNLNKMVDACDLWLDKSSIPPDISALTRLSLATGFGVLAGFYKDVARSVKYAEKALESLIQPTKPQEWRQKEWDDYRKENIGRLNQYIGLYKLRQASPHAQSAIGYLTKAAEIIDSPTYKDPNTYLLRTEAYTLIYTELNTAYNKLSTNNKKGTLGETILNEVYPVLDKMIEDYARVVALTEGKPELKRIYDEAKSQLDEFASFREKSATDLIRQYKQEFGIN